MALKLNPTREAYQEFYGRNVDTMSQLIADRRVPMNTAQLMQRRLDVRNADADVKSSWIDNYFDTGDAAAYALDGRVKIALDSQTLREMTPDSQRIGGALILTDEAYKALQGEEFKREKLGKLNERLSRKEVKAHPIWRNLARDQGLLNDYTDLIFNEYQARFAKDFALDDLRLMGIYPDSVGNVPKMRAWIVPWLEYGSSARGRYGLDDGNGRFVGIAPEALNASSAPGNSTSNIKTYTTADLQTFDIAIKSLEGTLRPEVLKPLVDLRKKL